MKHLHSRNHTHTIVEQTGNNLHEMIRMFRQNQSERLDQLPDLVQQHYGGDATLAI